MIEEVVESDGETIAHSHLLRSRCACGAVALHAPGRPYACGECLRRRTGAGQDWTALAGKYAPVHGFRVADVVAPVEQREPYPAPEFTSRDVTPAGLVTPGVVDKLVQRAVAASWSVAVRVSRGRRPHGSTGAPGAVKTLWGARLRSADRAWGAYAVHDGAAWVSTMLWGASLAWFPLASVTDLYEFVDSHGMCARDPEWCAGIRSRVTDSAARAKARAACNRGVHPRARVMAGGTTMWCPTCENSWTLGAEPWRRPKVGKTEAL